VKKIFLLVLHFIFLNVCGMQYQQQMSLVIDAAHTKLVPVCCWELDESINSFIKQYMLSCARLKELSVSPICEVADKELSGCVKLFRYVEDLLCDVHEKLALMRKQDLSPMLETVLYTHWLALLGEPSDSTNIATQGVVMLQLKMGTRLIDFAASINSAGAQIHALRTQKNFYTFRKNENMRENEQRAHCACARKKRILVMSAVGTGLVVVLTWCLLRGKNNK